MSINQSLSVDGKRVGIAFFKNDRNEYLVYAPSWTRNGRQEFIGIGKTKAEALKDARHQMSTSGHRQQNNY